MEMVALVGCSPPWPTKPVVDFTPECELKSGVDWHTAQTMELSWDMIT